MRSMQMTQLVYMRHPASQCLDAWHVKEATTEDPYMLQI